MIDRTTKILLGAIAAGLWANIAATQVRPASASTHLLQSMDTHLRSIDAYLKLIDATLNNVDGHTVSIALGVCTNQKICEP